MKMLKPKHQLLQKKKIAYLTDEHIEEKFPVY